MRKDEFPLVDRYVNQVLDNILKEIKEVRRVKNCSCADCIDIIEKYQVKVMLGLEREIEE